ncbi:ATP synthase subunit A, partial [candidate division MSBL1 archaeon SCGC-AAA259A05]
DLADKRHFPAINWLTSYSRYLDSVEDWWEEEVGENWRKYRDKAISILQEEDELREIVQLVGPDALPDRDRAVLEAAKVIREDFLQQNAMHEIDTYCSLEKQLKMFEIVLKFYDKVVNAVEEGAPVNEVTGISVRGEIARMKKIPENQFKKEAEKIEEKIDSQVKEVLEGK